MRIGVSALLFNIDEVLEIIRQNKKDIKNNEQNKYIKNNGISVNYMEINHIEIGIDNISDCHELKKYKDDIEQLQLSVGIHLPMELNLCEEIEFIRDSGVDFIKTLNENLSFLKIDYYNMHLGYVMTNRLDKNREKYLNNAVKFLDKLDEDLNHGFCEEFNKELHKESNKELYKEDEKICLTIENTYTKGGDFSNVGSKVDDFKYIFNNTKNKNVKFCYDTGHDLICSDDYFLLNKEFKVVHLSDNNGEIDEHLGINKGILKKDKLNEVLNSKASYLVLEMQLEDINNTLTTLKKNYYK